MSNITSGKYFANLIIIGVNKYVLVHVNIKNKCHLWVWWAFKFNKYIIMKIIAIS